jgi:hypothetical protein
MQNNQQLLPVLEEISKGRDFIKTSEFARLFSKGAQTPRKNYHLRGECFGIRPVKVGGHLLWPVAAIASLLSEGAAK